MGQDVIGTLGLQDNLSPKVLIAIDNLEKLYENIEKIQNADIKIGSKGGLTELNAKIKELEATMKSYDAQVLKAEKSKQASLKTDQEVIKVITLEDKATQQNIRTKQQALTYEQALAKEKAKGVSQANAEAKLAKQSIDYRAQMNRQLKEQEILYFNVAKSLGINSVEAETQLKKTLALRGEIEKLDNKLGNYQKSVGNYKTAFDGLGMSFTQVARELPSLTISAQQFFLAISNNLPMVFDEIGKARNEIAALKAAGEETPSLFSRIAKSAFSLQVGLSILVTLLTIFGGKIISAIGGLFGLDDATEKAAEATSKLQKAQLELIKTQEELNKLFADPINDNDRLSKTLAIYQSLGKSRGDQLEIEKKILENTRLQTNQDFISTGGFGKLEEYRSKLGSVSNDLLKLKELQAAGVDSNGDKLDKDAQDNLDKAVARKQIEFDLSKELFEKQRKVVQDNYNTQIELDAKLNEIKRYNEEQQLSREVEAAKISAETVINKNERILSDERNFEEKRTQALKDSAEQRKAIINADLRTIAEDPANTNSDGSETAQLVNARKKAAADISEIDKKLSVDIFKNQEEFRKRRLAAELEINKAEVTLAQEKYKEISTSDAHSFTERIDAYADYYRKSQEGLKLDYDFQKATKVMTNEELLALDADFAKKSEELAIRSRKEISDIIVSDSQNTLTNVEIDNKLALSKEELRLYKSLKNKANFAKKDAKLQRDSEKERLNDAIITDKFISLSRNTSAEAKMAADNRVKENETKLTLLSIEEEKAANEKKKENRDIFFQFAEKGVETFFALYKKLSDQRFQDRLDQLAQERKMLDENYSIEISNIRNSTLSEQEKQTQLLLAEQTLANKKATIAEKERQEKIKQAKNDKAIGIAQIIVQGALAVVKALPNYVLAAAAAVATAAELAVASATQIPSYFNETDNHPGGLARFGEVPEMVSEPGKRPYIQWNETVGELAKGTKVRHLTSDDVLSGATGGYAAALSDRLAIAERAEQLRQDNRELIEAVVYTGREMVRAVKSQRHNTTINIHSRWAEKIDRDVRR